MATEEIIKLYAGKTITESNLDKSSKVQLLNHVKESSVYEVMALLMDGEITEVSDESKQIVFERFKRSDIPNKVKYFVENDESLTEGTAKSIFGILINPALWLAWRSAKGIISKSQRKCGTFKIANERDICLLNYKIKSYEEQIKVLQKVKKEAKDKDKAKKVDKKINDLKEKINKTKEKINKKK